MEFFRVPWSLMAVLAMSLASCDEAGNRRQIDDVGAAPINDTSANPKADWIDENEDDSIDGVAPDGSDDGTDTADSSDATGGSDATGSSDVIDCSVPPDDCDFIDGQALICDEITGQPEEVWSFWNPETCAWDLNTETWPNPERVVVGGIPSHEAQSYLDVLECKVP